MHSLKSKVSLSVLATLMGAGALTSTPVTAKTDPQSIEAVAGQVRLVIKRELPNGDTRYDKLMVPVDELAARKAQLLQDPSVLRIERDILTFSPVPGIQPAPMISQAVLDGGDPVDYSDPDYVNQPYFRAGEAFNSRLSEAHGRVRFTNKIRIGIIDGGYLRSPEVTYSEGSFIHFGTTLNQFYNDDPEIACGDGASTHGDQVSQIAAANSNNGIGIAGATRNVDLIAASALGCFGSGTLGDAADQIRWSAGDTISGLSDISQPVDIINLSLTAPSSTCPTYMQDAVDYALARGITVIAASGNDSGDAAGYSPANCDGVIAVAATEADGGIADYSNLGAPVSVSAQGSQMPVLTEGERRQVFGTSFASPLVAGIVATAMSERPNLTPAEIAGIIAESGKPLNGDVSGVGSGILDAMLFMDGAGVPREAVTAQSALTGEREQYQAALTHPATTAFLQNETGTSGACELYQADGRYLETQGADDSIAVFSVASGEPLAPTDATALIINSTPGEDKLIITQADIDAAAADDRQLGVANCNLTTGANCSVKTSVKAFNPADIELPAICS